MSHWPDETVLSSELESFCYWPPHNPVLAAPDPVLESVIEEAARDAHATASARLRNEHLLVGRHAVPRPATWEGLDYGSRQAWRDLVRPVVRSLEEQGRLTRPEGLNRYRVKVDDPDMTSSHEYDVEALTPRAAAYEGARRAVLEDENAGMPSSRPIERDLVLRTNPGLVEAVVVWASVEGYRPPVEPRGG